MVLTLEFNNINNIFYYGRQKNLVRLFFFIVFFHSVNGPPPIQTTTTTSTTTTTTTTRNYTLNPAMFDPLPNCPMCDVPSGSIGVILDALWNQSSPSYSMPPTAAACSLENGDATVSYWSPTTVEPPVPSIGSYPSVASSNQQAFVFSSNRGTCLTPCFCTFDGSCYSPSNYTDFLVTFIPYCDSSGICIMYAVDQTYNPTNNGKAWFSDSGIQTPNLDPRVVPVGPDSPYPETKSFGCNGCDRLRALACPVTSTTDMTTSSELRNLAPICECNADGFRLISDHLLSGAQGQFAGYFASIDDCEESCRLNYGLLPCIGYFYEPNNLGKCTLFQYDANTNVQGSSNGTASLYVKCDEVGQNECDGNVGNTPATSPSTTTPSSCTDGFRLIANNILTNATGKFGGYFTDSFDCQTLCTEVYGSPKCIGFLYEPNNRGKCTIFQYTTGSLTPDAAGADLYVRCDESTPTVPITLTTIGMEESTTTASPTTTTTPLATTTLVTTATPTTTFMPTTTTQSSTTTLPATTTTPMPSTTPTTTFMPSTTTEPSTTTLPVTTTTPMPTTTPPVTTTPTTTFMPSTTTEPSTTTFPVTTTTPMLTTTPPVTTTPTTTFMPSTTTEQSTTTLPVTTTTPMPTTTPPVTTLPTTTFSTTTLSLSTQQMTTTNDLSIKTTLPYVTQSSICECNADGFRLISDHLLSGAQGNFAGYFTSIDDCEGSCRLNYGLLPCTGYFYEPNNLGKCTLFQYDANTNVQSSSNGTASLYVKCDEVSQNECDGNVGNTPATSPSTTTPSSCTDGFRLIANNILTNATGKFGGYFTDSFDCQTLCTEDYNLLKCIGFLYEPYNRGKCTIFQYTTGSLTPDAAGADLYVRCDESTPTPVLTTTSSMTTTTPPTTTTTLVPTTTTTTPVPTTTSSMTTTTPSTSTTTTPTPTTTLTSITTTAEPITTTPVPTTTSSMTTILPTTTTIASTTTIEPSTTTLTTMPVLTTTSPICECNADGFRLISDHLLSGAQGNFAGYFTSIDDCEEPCRLNYGFLPCTGYFYEPNNLGKCTLFQYDANVQDSSNGTASLYVKCDEVGQNECNGNVGNTLAATSPDTTTPSSCIDGFRLIANNILTNATGKFGGYFTNSFDCQTLCTEDYNLLKCIGFLYEPYNRGKCTIFQYTTGSLTPDAAGADLYVRCDESTPTPVLTTTSSMTTTTPPTTTTTLVPTTTTTTPVPTTTSSMTTILPTTTTIASTTTIEPSTTTLTTMPVLTTTSPICECNADGFRLISDHLLSGAQGKFAGYFASIDDCEAPCRLNYGFLPCTGYFYEPNNLGKCTLFQYDANTNVQGSSNGTASLYVKCDEVGQNECDGNVGNTPATSPSTTTPSNCVDGFRLIANNILTNATGKFGGYVTDSFDCQTLCADDYGLLKCIGFLYEPNNRGKCTIFQYTTGSLTPDAAGADLYVRCDESTPTPVPTTTLSMTTILPTTTTIASTTTIKPSTTTLTTMPVLTTTSLQITTSPITTTTLKPTTTSVVTSTLVPTTTPAATIPTSSTTMVTSITTSKPTTASPTTTTTPLSTTTLVRTTTPTTTFRPTTSKSSTSTTSTSTTSTTTPYNQCCQIGGVWSEWSDSGACNDTCGSCGLITRTRTCLSSPNCPCSGPSTRLDNCNFVPCTYPRPSCCTPYNVTKLANGTKICGPQTDPFEPEPLITGCMPDCCPAQGVWSQWSEPSGCNDTCGACGVGTRRRYCMTEGNGCPCTGADTQNVPCNLTPCKFPRNSCCIGIAQAINGTIICNMTTSIETPASLACTTASVCCPSGGTWSEWSTSQTCSVTCGSCAQLTYTRTCTSRPTCPCSGNSSKTVNCNLAPCLYPQKSCCGSYIAMFANGKAICGPQPVEPTDTPSDSIVCAPGMLVP